MAKARLYVLTPAGNDPKFVSTLKGQAAVVHRHLLAQNGEPKLASDIAEQVAASGELKTRQDVLRVTLYYIIVFKGRGRVAAVEAEVPEAPQSADAQLREHVEA